MIKNEIYRITVQRNSEMPLEMLSEICNGFEYPEETWFDFEVNDNLVSINFLRWRRNEWVGMLFVITWMIGLIFLMEEKDPNFGYLWIGDQSKELKVFDDVEEVFSEMEDIVLDGFTPLTILKESEVKGILTHYEQFSDLYSFKSKHKEE